MTPPVDYATHPVDPGNPGDRDSPADVSNPYSESYDPSHRNYDPTRDASRPEYFERGHTSDTGDEIRTDAEDQVNSEESDDGWLGPLINGLFHDGRVNTTVTEEMSAQAKQLAVGVDTRTSPDIPASYYRANPHPELKSMVTDDVDPDAVGEMGDTWIEAGNAMVRFQSGVAAAINKSEADWQGSAGDSARTFMADVGNWVGTAGQSAQLAGTQTNLQSQALSTARNGMPEPVEFDVDAANRDLQTIEDPDAYMDAYNGYMDQYNAQQEAHERAADVVGTYDQSLAGTSTMPAFGPPPTMSGSGGSIDGTIGSESIGGTGDSSFSQNPSNSMSGNNTGNNTGNYTGTPNIPPVTGDPGGPNSPSERGGDTSSSRGGDTSSSRGGDTSPSRGGDLPGDTPPPSSNPPRGGSNQGGLNHPGAPMPVGMGGLPGGNDLERGGRGGGSAGGRGGFGPGGGYGGGSGGAGGGPGGGSGGAGGRGMGAGGLGGAGGLAAAENAAGRGGGAGRGGMMPMGGGGAGRGQNEEDEEHQRPSFLVEADPDSVFGTDEATAPPVIGS